MELPVVDLVPLLPLQEVLGPQQLEQVIPHLIATGNQGLWSCSSHRMHAQAEQTTVSKQPGWSTSGGSPPFGLMVGLHLHQLAQAADFVCNVRVYVTGHAKQAALAILGSTRFLPWG